MNHLLDTDIEWIIAMWPKRSFPVWREKELRVVTGSICCLASLAGFYNTSIAPVPILSRKRRSDRSQAGLSARYHTKMVNNDENPES
jgi:hypothetical protein